MEPVMIAVAFGCGMLVNLIGLPPLLGFLAVNFLLNGMGYQNTPALNEIADLGVTLLLFTIGLKLNVKILMRRDVWGTTSLHLLLSTLLFTVVLLVCKGLGLALAMSLDWRLALLLGFALSFSSTVFAVKVLEERSDMNALYARLAVGVLVMQDLFAVAFLAVSSGQWPSIWALWILGLPLLRLAAENCWSRPVTASCRCCSGSSWRWWWGPPASRWWGSNRIWGRWSSAC